MNANVIWQDYISYVAERYPVPDGDSRAESLRFDTLRKLYQRAVVSPINNLECPSL